MSLLYFRGYFWPELTFVDMQHLCQIYTYRGHGVKRKSVKVSISINKFWL
jgi:hypothetical protein